MHLNCPLWLETFLRFARLEWLKMHLNFCNLECFSATGNQYYTLPSSVPIKRGIAKIRSLYRPKTKILLTEGNLILRK